MIVSGELCCFALPFCCVVVVLPCLSQHLLKIPEFTHTHSCGYLHIYIYYSCHNHVHINILRCEDYILIDLGTLGTTELCGNDTLQQLAYTLEFGSTNVTFRTSESVQGVGFMMLVICFRETDRDLPGMNDQVF